MSLISRRDFLRHSATAMTAAALMPDLILGQAGAERPLPPLLSDLNPGAIGKPIGRIRPVRSADVQASLLSVGFETLDRQHFDPQRAYPHLAELGVKWARCQTGWCRCETVRGQFDFSWLDEVVDSLLDIGIQPWFNLGYGNQLYTPEADATAVGWAPVFDPATLDAWLRFTRELARHFRSRVRHWEIWNEPNIRGFWKPEEPQPEDYARLVAATAPVIREGIDDAVIIGGAFAGVPVDYARACFEHGLAEHADKVSYHPYRPVPDDDSGERQVLALRELVAQYDPQIRLWQGENGCPSKGGGDSVGALSNLEWDEQRQAKWLLRRILTDLRLGAELTSYFHTVDLVGYRGKTNYKGLLRGADYTPKPAFFAYQSLCALFDARTQATNELRWESFDAGGLPPEDAAKIRYATFVRNGAGMAAYWYPANLQTGWQPGVVGLRLTVPDGIAMEQPVLLDPLTGQAYDLTDAELDGNAVALQGLPLMDYPLIIADRSVAGLGHA